MPVKVKSLKKALDVLSCFTEKQPMGVSEISEKLGLNKSNVYDILQTFVELDYLDQDHETGKYYLGLGILKFSRAVGNKYNFHNIALEYMKVLSDEVEETIYLTVPMQRRIYYLEVIRPSQGRYLTGAMRAATDYMHVTSCGKAMMAYMPEGFLEKYFQKPVVAYTKNSITDIDALREELRRIRMRGYAIDNMENSEDMRCVGVPIKTRNGTVVGALSISGSPEKLTPERIDFLAKKMKEYAFHIEEVL